METKTIDDICIVTIMPRFDAYTANDIETILKTQITKGTKKIIADFSKTEYIASAGLRVLLSTAKKLNTNGGKIVLSTMKSQIHEVFEISGFTQIFKIYPSQKEALEDLK